MESLVTGITTYVYTESHTKLKALADDRGVSIRTVAGLILEWGATKTLKELFDAGVQLPVFPAELETLQGDGDK